MPRRRPVQIRAELEETDTTYILHIKPVSSAKAHRNLDFALTLPKEGITSVLNARDVVYEFLLSVLSTEEADKIITKHPVRYWSKFVDDEGILDTSSLRGEIVHDNPDQDVHSSTESERPTSGITKGLIPRS